MNIIFDLDGTLSCCKQRMYALFNHLVKESDISYDSYWTLKYSGLTNEEIITRYFCYTQQQINGFIEGWMELIESDNFIKYDYIFPEIRFFLKELSYKADLYVCTARQSKNIALNQLELFGLLPIFKKILVTEQKKTKADLIIENIDISEEDWIIGDTGHDIQTGKKININTCAVLSGITNRFNLQKYEPTKIIDKTTCFTI